MHCTFQHAITYSIVASSSGTFFFDINANTNRISVNGDLTQSGATVFVVCNVDKFLHV